ncbi:MAG: fumarylacetoacetate hydrolase family protein [Beijerinckiaceae bacterium]|nr:fumarylacetoacetate hydrolase family protein [Beijerinckiaceae bacterium]
MKICRFDDDRVGVVENDMVRDVTQAVADALPAVRWPLPLGDLFIANLDSLLPKIRAALPSARALPLSSVRLNSPVANPPHIIAAPLNYPLHVQEAADPAINHGVHMPTHEGFATPIDKYGLFLKSHTGVIGPGQKVVLHWPGRRNDHEVELGVVIGRGGKDISRNDAMSHVAGYCIALDITVRGTEDRSFRKAADTYSVLGPWLVTADEIADPANLEFGIEVDGQKRQRSNTKHLICDIPDLIERASRVYALNPGDVIMTGTPDGVGEITSGCVMHAWIEGIGEMNVHVA